jgi:hypothetical protein
MFICELPESKDFSEKFDLASESGSPRFIHYFQNKGKESPIKTILLCHQNNKDYERCILIQLIIDKKINVFNRSDVRLSKNGFLERFPRIQPLSCRGLDTIFQLGLRLDDPKQALFDIIKLAKTFDSIDPAFIQFFEQFLNISKPEDMMVVPEKPSDGSSSSEISSCASSQYQFFAYIPNPLDELAKKFEQLPGTGSGLLAANLL